VVVPLAAFDDLRKSSSIKTQQPKVADARVRQRTLAAMLEGLQIAKPPIQLAEEPDFLIGTLCVRPSRGEIEAGSRVTRLEPRLMQVLVALVEGNGETVSREELIARCWGGVVVSPDALNRAISLLRKLLESNEAAAELKTLPRIGYRLIKGGRQSPAQTTTQNAGARHPTQSTSSDDEAPYVSRNADIDPMVRDLLARAVVGLEQPSREPLEQSLAYLKQAVVRAPNFAPGWAALAEAQRLLMLYLPAAMQGPARAESSRSVDKAIALDPTLGQVYATLANLIPKFNNWSEVEALIHKGLAVSPDSTVLIHAQAQFLLAVGRTAEAIERLAALRAINALSPSITIELASALLDAGRADEAIHTIDEAYELWPAVVLVWSECVRLHLVAGNYSRAQALLDAPPPPVGPDDPNLARRRLHLIARRDRRPADLAAACKNFLDFSRIGIAPATVSIHALTTLDLPEVAIAIADEIFRPDPALARAPGVNMIGTYPLAGQPDTTVMFRRDTANLRSLAGFEIVLDRIGLNKYWRQSGSQPDFLRHGAPSAS